MPAGTSQLVTEAHCTEQMGRGRFCRAVSLAVDLSFGNRCGVRLHTLVAHPRHPGGFILFCHIEKYVEAYCGRVYLNKPKEWVARLAPISRSQTVSTGGSPAARPAGT